MTKKTSPVGQAIDRRLSALCLPEDFAQRVTQATPKKCPRLVYFRRPLAVAAVLCLVVTCSMGVWAAATPSSHNLFSILGEQVFSLLQPEIGRAHV